MDLTICGVAVLVGGCAGLVGWALYRFGWCAGYELGYMDCWAEYAPAEMYCPGGMEEGP